MIVTHRYLEPNQSEMSEVNESTGLLPGSNKSPATNGVTESQYAAVEEVREVVDINAWSELSQIVWSSLPMIVTFFLQYSLTLVSIWSVGHLGKTELAAVSLATMTFNVSVSVFNGMATCLDTFCAQAYGAKKYDLVGVYFQRCSAMILMCSIPLIVFWCFSYHVFALLVTDLQLAVLAQQFLRIMACGTPGYIMFETGKRFLQAQNIFVGGQYCLFICAPLNFVLNYTLVWNKTVGIGFAGAPLATAISYWLMSILLLCYAVFVNGKDCWYGLQIREAFRGWGPMMKLALNGTAMMLSEFVAFEILTLSVSRLGTTALAAQSVVSSVATLAFQIPFGVSVASSTRIANYVGAGLDHGAKVANNVTLLLAGLVGFLNFLWIFVFRRAISSSFTDEVDVISLASTVFGILALNQLFDSPNIILAGVLRGQGRQHIGSALNLFAYYVVAVPLALYMAFSLAWHLVGLWVGLGVGIILLALAEGYFVIFRSNWKEIMKDAESRNEIS